MSKSRKEGHPIALILPISNGGLKSGGKWGKNRIMSITILAGRVHGGKVAGGGGEFHLGEPSSQGGPRTQPGQISQECKEPGERKVSPQERRW